MDTHFISQLFLSILFFAPGIVLLAGLAFVGVLMFVEKFLGHAQVDVALAAPAAVIPFAATGNPGPGSIVSALKESMNQTAANRQRKVNRQ